MKVLTFNTGLFYLKIFGRTLMEFVPFVDVRLEHQAREIIRTGADIVALQEVFSHKHKLHFIEALKEVYPYHATVPNNQLFIDNGLMVFSVFPITHYQLTKFKRTLWIEHLLAHRGYLEVTIDHPTIGQFHLFNVHTTVGGTPLTRKHGRIARNIRNAQVAQLMHWVNGSAIVCGDFNTTPTIEGGALQHVREKGLIGLDHVHDGYTWDVDNPTNLFWLWKGEPSQNIDHVFATPELMQNFEEMKIEIVLNETYDAVFPGTKTIARKIALSDHYGLMVTFE